MPLPTGRQSGYVGRRMSFDIIIREATVYDGRGGAAFEADVAILGDRVADVGTVSGAATREIRARGLAVSPGFIDVHTHDDFAALIHRDMAFKSRGGVTTCVVGNCGFGAAPWAQGSLLAAAFHGGHDVPRFEGFAGYFSHLDQHPPGVNIGVLVGHGTLRLAAMGADARAPEGAEMEAMKANLRQGLAAGALGLSTGLIYEPGRHATTEEIIELASEMRGTRGLYATHMRDESKGLVPSVEEAIRIGEEAGVPVQISHHKAAGRQNWGLVRESLARIEQARARGLAVHADQYPYTAGSTALSAALLNDMAGPNDVVIASSPPHPEWEGKSLADLAREFGTSSAEATQRVRAGSPRATVIVHTMNEDDVRTVLRHPSTMIGSDGIPTLEGKPHPRLYNTFARVLGHYARDENVLPLEEAIHRMTGLSADVFGLHERGYVRAGAFADLVVFDPTEIIDRGTFDDPNRYPEGIRHVFVNGVEVADGEKATGAFPGRALRRHDD